MKITPSFTKIVLRAVAELGRVTIKGVAYFAQNGNELGLVGGGFDGAVAADAPGGNVQIIDNETIGYCFTVGFKFSDRFFFEMGYGGVEHEMEDAGPASISGALTKDDRIAYYALAHIRLAKTVILAPEVGKDDYKNNRFGTNQGDRIYFGVKFQIDF